MPRGTSVSGDSFIVRLFGLDGLREHWMPGNRRRGTPAREKRRFDTEAEAQAFLEAHPRMKGGSVYQCGICDQWHTASPERR